MTFKSVSFHFFLVFGPFSSFHTYAIFEFCRRDQTTFIGNNLGIAIINVNVCLTKKKHSQTMDAGEMMIWAI